MFKKAAYENYRDWLLTFACVYYSTASDNGTTAQPFVYTLSIPVSNAVIRNWTKCKEVLEGLLLCFATLSSGNDTQRAKHGRRKEIKQAALALSVSRIAKSFYSDASHIKKKI